MSLAPIRMITGRAVPLMADDIDTDVIIPARFLRCVTFDGLGEHVFADARRVDGEPTGHPLDDPRFAGATVLLAGRNFGCGSSREHAPQALKRAGIAAIVAESFAGIFAGNALGIGLVCATAPRTFLDALSAAVHAEPALAMTLDVDARTLTAGVISTPLGINDAARDALLTARFDPLTELLSARDAVAGRLESLPWTAWNAL